MFFLFSSKFCFKVYQFRLYKHVRLATLIRSLQCKAFELLSSLFVWFEHTSARLSSNVFYVKLKHLKTNFDFSLKLTLFFSYLFSFFFFEFIWNELRNLEYLSSTTRMYYTHTYCVESPLSSLDIPFQIEGYIRNL